MTTASPETNLLDRVTARIYQQNAFRVTGLPPTATGREIRRTSDMLAAVEKIGGHLPAPKLLPLTPPATADAVRAALDRLGDPRQRLVDEFFWLWPVEAGAAADEALTAVAAGDLAGAVRHWTDLAAAGDAHSEGDIAAAIHNLALLPHLEALDAEAARPRAAPGTAAVEPDWASIYSHWARVVRDERVWVRLAERITRAADARLDRRLANAIRSALPAALLTIGAELVVSALSAGETDRAGRHLTAMRASRLGRVVDPDGTVNADAAVAAEGGGTVAAGSAAHADDAETDVALAVALRRAGQPWADQVARLCEEAERLAQAARTSGLDQAERVLTESTGPLGLVDQLLAADDPTRVRVHDQVALAALRCLLIFDGTRSRLDVEDSEGVRNHLRMAAALTWAERVAGSPAIRDRLTENATILQDASLYVTCWVCHRNPAVASSASKIWLHRDVVREYSGVRWKKQQVSVPRCKSCEGRETSQGCSLMLRIALYFTVAISIPTILFSGGGGFIFLAVVAAIVAVGVDASVFGGAATRRHQAHLRSFPPLVEMRQEGWQFGERPPGVTSG
ncbi:conserved hypothetical protein [Frankia sp. AiPs1]|uniref:hypothetical protein n=1 Tax=Frankia sp. AiPa1 TaxID=573492 RepID=UPI00202B92A4|nr:hypothetical protein [Frankia sp. AiPa1]MCL9762716.1 hypothetical protein [Frankia sp. AiPa1]